MLRVTQQASTAAAKSYYSSADYYRDGEELAGIWGGRGAAAVGLEGVVDKAAFDALCENRHPTRDTPLTARTRLDRTVGYDFTWSVPKSVSLLHALTGDPELVTAFRESVDETMRDIEAEMKVRVRVRGADADRVTGNAVWATFVHTTSRPVGGIPDPQLHAHCFVFNATFDTAEGRWKAGQFRDLKRDAPYWQAAFRARLAGKLTALGYDLETHRDDFEIAGIPKATLKKFSRRTTGIESVAAERGITDPERKAELGAKTREAKATHLSPDELRQEWASRLTDTEAAVLARTHGRESAPLPLAITAAEAIDHALLHTFETRSVASDKELLAAALRYGIGGVSVEDVRREFASRQLIVREVDGRRLVTTPEVLAEERKVVAFARDGRGKHRALGGFGRPFKRDWLSDEQKRAVEHLWQSPDRVILLRGAAGTGKTTLLQEVVEGIEAGDTPVVALAPSAEAGWGVLREAGFANAGTVARFLTDQTLHDSARGGVILVDEASLLGARTMAKLFDAAATLDARVILVGDTAQHGPVERGDALRLIEREAGVPVATVTEIRRQQGSYRDAVKLLADGRILEGFDRLNKFGWVKEATGGDRHQLVAADYLQTVSERGAKGELRTALVISPSHAEGAKVTAAIRERLKAAGKLGDERTFATWVAAGFSEAEGGDARNYEPGDMLQFHQNAPTVKSGSRVVIEEGKPAPVAHPDRFQAYHAAELAVAVGERLRVTANGKTKDGKHRLNNGTILTVRGFTPRGDLVADNGWVVDRDFGHLSHGYVVTSHASQGKTVDRVLIAQGAESLPASSREQFYVSASRARESVAVYTDDKAALREAIRRDSVRPTATDLARQPPPPPTDRPRWQKHLALLRRWASFARTHLSRQPLERAPQQQLEVHHDR